MALPPDFRFSQSSLQDYVDCQRRFQLRYLLEQPWPAVEMEPISEREDFLKRGAIFHRIVQRHLVGVQAQPPEDDAELRGWWENWLQYGLEGLPEQRHAEVLLSTNLGGVSLMARYDLIAVEPGRRAVIVDWKTARQRPSRRWAQARLQTRIYRYLLVKAGTHLNEGRELPPLQVEMVYWFTNFPDMPERLAYNERQFFDDETYLQDLVEAIKVQEDEVFPLTDDERKCRLCTYRTLCGRGDHAGTMDEADAFLLAGDFDDELGSGPITELEF